MRRARIVVFAVLVLVVAGAVALFLAGRSRLDGDQGKVDESWTSLRAPLAARYLQLAALDNAFRTSGGEGQAVAQDLQPLLERWGRYQQSEQADAEAEAETANELEGAARRLIATVRGSARLAPNEGLQAAIAAFEGAAVPEPVVADYNRRVRDYQDTREGTLWAPTADMLGYDARSVLVIAP